MKHVLLLFLMGSLPLVFVACGGTSDSETALSRSEQEESLMTDTNSVSSDVEVTPVDLTLKYDDRYTFPDAIEDVETVSVSSQQTGTDKPDDRVLRKKSNADRNVGIAIGVGEAKVTLKSGQVYNVTVEPAPLSVLLIIGQSNGEGSTTGEPEVYNKARNQSIVCEEGQVYSTYGWSTVGHATYVAGFSSKNSLTTKNAENFVARTLTTTSSRGGGTLEYPLNTLSSVGKGKTGFDSGLAWNWHELTGDKVWVVNCAAGSTAIEVWQPGAVRSDNCVALMKQVRATLEEEIAAGHYTLNSFSAFWLQGESNKESTEAEYFALLENMYANLKKDVLLAEEKPMDGMGIVMVRAFATTDPSVDTVDNGPRKAQKAAISASDGVFADVYLACIENDKWISNQAVAQYWEEAYPGNEYPFRIQTGTYKNPRTIAEVHNGVHYLQPGYNEIGIVAARNAVAYLRGN